MHTTLVSPVSLDTASPIAETTSYTLPIWPLQATQTPHAHLTWTEWCARRATPEAAAEHIAAVEQIVRAARELVDAAV